MGGSKPQPAQMIQAPPPPSVSQTAKESAEAQLLYNPQLTQQAAQLQQQYGPQFAQSAYDIQSQFAPQGFQPSAEPLLLGNSPVPHQQIEQPGATSQRRPQPTVT